MATARQKSWRWVLFRCRSRVQLYPTGAALTLTPSHGAFPSQSVWYLTAGADATADLTVAEQRRLTRSKGWTRRAGRALQASPYQGEVVKTTDGGQTWTQVYKQQGKMFLVRVQLMCAGFTLCAVACFAPTIAIAPPAAPGGHFR